MTIADFLQAYDRITSHGWLALDEALLLMHYAEQTKGNLVEVGSYMGRSAMLLSQLGRPLYCVDPWDDKFSTDLSGEEIFARFQTNVASVPGAKVYPVRTRVEDWQGIPAGFVFLDGDHTYDGTVTQVEKAMQCHPTYIAVHDIADDGAGAEIVRATSERLGSMKTRTGRLGIWEL